MTIVTVLLAAHDAQATLEPALRSVLAQTTTELELLVVDDGSTDATPEILAAIDDPRLVVLRNEKRVGLASSLNRGLDAARGRWVARLDADDVARPVRLERQLAVATAGRHVIVGSDVADIDEAGSVMRVHELPRTDLEIRWHALFSSPFYHPTVLFDRELLDHHELRYDAAFEESEDFDLWLRVLAVGSGRNVAEPLVFYRVHPGQATQRRRDLQRSFQRTAALRAIGAVAPELDPTRADLAWRVGAREPVDPADRQGAVEAFQELVEAFGRAHGRAGTTVARRAAARVLAGTARHDGDGGALLRAMRLDPLLVPRGVARTRHRRQALRTLQRTAHGRSVPNSGRAVRVTVVSPEPTPFRSLMFDRLAERDEIDFRVVYSARTIFSRTWTLEHHHPHVFLDGLRVPGFRRVFRHDAVITRGLADALVAGRPDVVVVSGWSTHAARSAARWANRQGVPYVLLVESNDRDPRPAWRRVAKQAVANRIVHGAERTLAIGTLAAESVVARGGDPDRLGRFANTVDVVAFEEHARRLAPHRDALRARLGASDGDVMVVSVARLAPEKGLDVLLRAVAAADDPRFVVVVAGEGPERAALEGLARELGVRLVLLGDLQPWEKVFDVYAAADVFALLSRHEPWGVVVNEAAAFGLPLVLSDRVGAAFDLLVDRENGFRVPGDDVAQTAAALRALADDPDLRATQGERSAVLMRDWGYEPSLDAFVSTVVAAARR